VPGLSWDITRFKDVHLVGYDLDGNELDIHATEYQARIFQHETDHLDGHLLIERLDADQRRDAKIFLRENRDRLGASDHDGLHRLFGE
jgi:peptide deformylase